jgi:hypothetical protein
MKNSIINMRGRALAAQGRLALIVVNGVLLLLGAGLPGKAEHLQLDFPAKPAGVTNRPTMSQPEIELSSTLAEKLGGSDVTNLLVPSIAHLLNQTERFTLTHGKQARCRCIVRLTELAIHQVGGKTKFNIGQATQVFGGLFKTKDLGIPSQFADLSTNINWCSDKVQISVRCAVSVEVVDATTDIVLAEDVGEETRTNTAKAIGLELVGLAYGKEDNQNADNNGNASTSGAGVDYQSRLIQLASYRAICNFLPKLDQKLLALADAPASEKPSNEEISTASTTSPQKLFCANCGKAASTGDKFCTSCGTRLSK